MNNKEAFQMGADAVAKPTENKLNEFATILKQSSNADALQEFSDIVIDGLDELSCKNLHLSKITKIKDIGEDNDVSILMTLVDKYCDEDGFDKNDKVKSFLHGLHGIDRNYISDLGIEYDSIGDTEDTMPCSRLLYIIILTCNYYAGDQYNKNAYEHILDNICLSQKDKSSLLKTVNKMLPIYHPNKFATLLSGCDFEAMYAKREQEFDEFQTKLREKESQLNQKEQAQNLKAIELENKEAELDNRIAKQGNGYLVKSAIQSLASANCYVILSEKIPTRIKSILAKKIGKGQITPDEILAYYTANVALQVFVEEDLKIANFANGLLLTETGMVYHENGILYNSQYMSYSNIKSVTTSKLHNFIVVTGKEGSKLKITKHLHIDNDSIVEFINTVIKINS